MVNEFAELKIVDPNFMDYFFCLADMKIFEIEICGLIGKKIFQQLAKISKMFLFSFMSKIPHSNIFFNNKLYY